MESNNFEQQFVQNIKATTPPIKQNTKQKHGPSAITVVASIFMVIQLVLSIIILINLSSSSYGYEEIEWDEVSADEEEDEGKDGIYDDNGYLVSMNASCKSEDNTTIIVTEKNTYQKLDPNSTVLSKGTYTVTRGSVFKFANPESETSILFYDGYSLTDGTIFYNCEAYAAR